MNLKHKACTLFFLFLSASTSLFSASNLPVGTPPTAKAFVLDTSIWPYNAATTRWDIPVCWENLSVITANPNLALRTKFITRRAQVISYANSAWGITGGVSRLYFSDKGQCPTSVVFNGIRIYVSSTLTPPFPYNTLYPPYVKALGSKLNNMRNGVIFDLDFIRASYLSKCAAANPGISADQCFKASVIHEFGHIIGMSHEQNRSDDPYSILKTCSYNDFDPTPFGTTVIGNIKISSFDTLSIMNYCNTRYPGTTALSSVDKLATRIYYGNMPSLNTPIGYTNQVGKGIMIIRIPSLKIGTTYYNATLSRITDANKDGIYDNVFTLVKTPILGNFNTSSYPVTVINGIMDIKMAKRTVSTTSYSYPLDAKVYYLGHWELKPIAGTLDNWYLTGNSGSFNAQYPITQGK